MTQAAKIQTDYIKWHKDSRNLMSRHCYCHQISHQITVTVIKFHIKSLLVSSNFTSNHCYSHHGCFTAVTQQSTDNTSYNGILLLTRPPHGMCMQSLATWEVWELLKWLTLLEPRLKYYRTRSIAWLLMPWLLSSPGHQQPYQLSLSRAQIIPAIMVFSSQDHPMGGACSNWLHGKCGNYSHD